MYKLANEVHSDGVDLMLLGREEEDIVSFRKCKVFLQVDGP